VAQVAVSFMLLIGAGLMIRSFIKLQQVNPGFNPDRLLTMRLSANFSRYKLPQQFTALTDNILRRTKDIPGVQSVALASNFPFNPAGIVSGPGAVGFEIEGRPLSKGELAPLVDTTTVTPEYFQTIRQPLVQGRLFTDHDDATALPVVVINQTMARHRWPNADPIGKRVTFDRGEHWTTIIGIVGDTKEYGLDQAVGDELYGPVAQNGGITGRLVVRTAADPMVMSPLVRAALHDIDSQLAVDHMDSVRNLEALSMTTPRVTTILLGIFAGLALLISACGIGAVMALSVRQRTQELGIRIALGAAPGSVVCMVVRQGLLLAMVGTATGIAGAIALTRLLSALLYDTSPTDGFTFIAVSVLFLSIAAFACFIPARQVTTIDPLIALRQE
jgi:predicted permease